MRPQIISRGYLGCWTHLCSQLGPYDFNISVFSHRPCMPCTGWWRSRGTWWHGFSYHQRCLHIIKQYRRLTEVLMVVEGIRASGHHLAHVICFLSTQNGHVWIRKKVACEVSIPKQGVGTSASSIVAALLTPEYGSVPPLLIKYEANITIRKPLSRQRSRDHHCRTCYKTDQLTFLFNYYYTNKITQQNH